MASNVFGGINGDSSPPFLLVDSLQESEIVVHFASLSKWFDPNAVESGAAGVEVKKDGMFVFFVFASS